MLCFDAVRYKMAKNTWTWDDTEQGGQFDASMPPLARFCYCANSGIVSDRKAAVRILLEVFETVDVKDVADSLPSLMQKLATIADECVLISYVLEHVPQIAARALVCASKCSEFNDVVSEYLLPLVVKNLGYHDATIDKTAQATLVELIKLGFISKLHIEIKVCPSVLALTDTDNVDVISASIILMSKLAPLLGRDLIERVFLKRFAQLCSHKEFIVRKFCTSHFGVFCAIVGSDTFEKILLPCYLALCADPMWGVRKSAASVIMFISCACSLETRKNKLAPIFVQLLEDECKWVRMIAFYSLGPFISTFATPTMTHIAYNTCGDLVLVNNDGSEFLVDTLPDKQCYLEKSTPYKDFPILHSREDNENINMDGEDAVHDHQQSDPPPPPPETDSGDDASLSDEVAVVDNDVLLSSTVDNSNLNNCPSNGNVIESKNCDKLGNALEELRELLNSGGGANTDAVDDTDVNRNIEKPVQNGNYTHSNAEAKVADNESKPADQVINKSDTDAEDDLHLFNSYNYWYIEPQLPLDPDLIKGLPRVENGAGDLLSSNLEELYANMNLDDKLNFVQVDESNVINIWEDTFTIHDTLSDKNDEDDDEDSISEKKKPQQDIVPQQLIDNFVYMTNPELVEMFDNDILYHCAYSLPAVAITLGQDNWSLLKKTARLLAVHTQYRVRKTLACSLHELALILGPDLATEYLMPLFDGFMKDLDEVRIGILKHLSQFLKLISTPERNAYLPRLKEFLITDHELNWRFREELGNQLLLSLPLYKANDIAKHIGSIAQELLCDKVFAVREVAIALVIEIVKNISCEAGLTPHLLIKLAEKLAHSKIWKRRQTYALLCSELLSKKAVPSEQFASEVLPHLLDLSWDPVANVRLVVARILFKYFENEEYFSNKNSEDANNLVGVLTRLRADKDRDVREAAGDEKPWEEPY